MSLYFATLNDVCRVIIYVYWNWCSEYSNNNKKSIDCMPSRDYKWRSNERKQREQQNQWQNRNTCANELLQLHSNSRIFHGPHERSQTNVQICYNNHIKTLYIYSQQRTFLKRSRKLHRTLWNSEGKEMRRKKLKTPTKITENYIANRSTDEWIFSRKKTCILTNTWHDAYSERKKRPTMTC